VIFDGEHPRFTVTRALYVIVDSLRYIRRRIKITAARRRLLPRRRAKESTMAKHRNPRARLSKRPTPGNPTTAPTPEPLPPPPPEPDDEVDHLICVLRDQLRRTDAFVTSAEKELLVSWGVGEDDEDDGVQRLRMRVEYLVEAGKLAVREAQYTSEQLAAELAMQRRGA
jgi:hypothetical protein